MRKALTIFVLTMNVLLHAATECALRISTRVQFAPGYQRLTAVVELDPRNRQYCIIYEGPNSGSRCRQLDGQTDPRTQPLFELKDLPAGAYQAQVKVWRNDGSVISSRVESWEVYGEGYERPEEP